MGTCSLEVMVKCMRTHGVSERMQKEKRVSARTLGMPMIMGHTGDDQYRALKTRGRARREKERLFRRMESSAVAEGAEGWEE